MGANKARKRTRPTRTAMVSLVSMPFKDLRHPPIQLGILQRCLERAGISASSHSLELAFMEHLHARSAAAGGKLLTTADYQEVATQAFLAHLGDWVFMTPPYAEPSAEHTQIGSPTVTHTVSVPLKVPRLPRAPDRTGPIFTLGYLS
jgi:hypothetical protein